MRFLESTHAALGAALLLTFASPSALSTTPTTCLQRTGGGSGVWTTPEYHGGSGTLDGVVTLRGAPATTYTFQAVLTARPQLGPIVCLACLGGELQGTLDDGIGSGPDYYVSGSYFGLFSSGSGRFRAVIRDTPFPVAPPIGTAQGTFLENPGLGTPGAFWAKLELCD